MKIITFNILKPLAFTALFIVFASSFNTAEANWPCIKCKALNDKCRYSHECPDGSRCFEYAMEKSYCWREGKICCPPP